MTSCPVCGGLNFTIHAGYYYCSECQTQSQDLQEQVYEFSKGDVTAKSTKTSQKKEKKSLSTSKTQGSWTSWEAFNYILHGMTQEVMALGAPSNFETVVLQLWACYLKECNVAFLSRHKEAKPKLGFLYKNRDAKIIYSIDPEAKPKRKRKADLSSMGDQSDSSFFSMSRSSLGIKRRNVLTTSYEEMLLSQNSETSASLANETLESLTKSFDSDAQSDAASTISRYSVTSKDLKRTKRLKKSRECYETMRKNRQKEVDHISKSKLLSLLHVALLLTGSEIQLGDLLRFIREGHISYAKVSHFLPEEIKFARNELSYINSVSDTVMPTHTVQRKVGGDLVRCLHVDTIPCPPMKALTDRYCRDLHLPEYMSVYVERVLASFPPKSSMQCRPRKSIVNYEGRAMAIILFTMKLLFGLDGKTEVLLSDIAKKINRLKGSPSASKLFVFEDWMSFIECRETVLNEFHYPTQELLGRNLYTCAKGFIDTLKKEERDENYDTRFIPDKATFLEPEVLEIVKRTISSLQEPNAQNPTRPILFPPSLTPRTSNLRRVIEILTGRDMKEHHTLSGQNCEEIKLPDIVMKENFKLADMKFVLKPRRYLKVLKKENFTVVKKTKLEALKNKLLFVKQNREAMLQCLREQVLKEVSCDVTVTKSSDIPQSSKTATEVDDPTPCTSSTSNEVVSVHKDTSYWVLDYTSSKQRLLANFSEEILQKAPHVFTWLLRHCAMMVEMPPRDLYDELLHVERIYGFFLNVKTNFKKLKKDFEEW